MAIKNKVETPSESAVPPPKKRGQYRKKECPYCHNHYGNLENHIKMKHGTEAEADGRHTGSVEMTKDNLIGVKTEKPPEPKPESRVYFCTDCKAELRKGENPCWNCGATLVWEGLE